MLRQAASRHFSSIKAATPGIVFPGSGIHFWWQAGAVSALAARYDVRSLQFAGVSGGALAATMAACGGCDGAHALDVALRLVDESGALRRGPMGLVGIWGGMVCGPGV